MPSPTVKPASAAPRWQTVATVLLILHLFCLAIGVAVNAGGGRSMLGQQLRVIPFARQYLQLLLMDVGYDFDLAGAGPDDGVHRLELLPAEAASDDSTRPIAVLPDDSMASRIRRRRYQLLGFHVAYFDKMFEENADLRTQLPLEVAERWIADEQLPNGQYVLKCVRLPSKRLPRAIAAEVSYAYVMREGGLQQQVVETPPPEPVKIFLIWDPIETHYQGSRETVLGQRSEVVRNEKSSSPTGEDGSDAEAPSAPTTSPSDSEPNARP
jgi:hypothetical protein